jgi:hypothetical protein
LWGLGTRSCSCGQSCKPDHEGLRLVLRTGNTLAGTCCARLMPTFHPVGAAEGDVAAYERLV